mmetsp:Transcript_7361/g.12870  ORF Transcript_7361/g.12870 Transcript_7361/m.12870 type:complete len:1490 (+) Transcript_7361:225-4694(+)
MGRKHRSSSLGNSNSASSTFAAKPPQATRATPASSSTHHAPLDLAACHTLLHHFVHSKDADGRTVLHRAIEAASSSSSYSPSASASASPSPLHCYTEEEDEKLDGLYLTDALSTRLKEVDALTSNKARSGKQQQTSSSHFYRMMLAQDNESGYTTLHYAIMRRDLTTLLVLLRHASSSSSMLDGGGLSSNNMQMMQHPLRLLDGNVMRDDDEHQYNIIDALAASLDHERLTPLQLLGRTSANGLENCRRTLQWKSLRKMWKKQKSPSQQQAANDGSDENNPRRYRRRMISFGDDRDHDSLSYEIAAEEDLGDRSTSQHQRERRVRSGSFNVQQHERRVRSASFNVDLDEGHNEDEEEEEDDVAGANNNDLMPLQDVDFSVLANNENTRNQQQQQPKSPQPLAPNKDDDYGCEVLTFGRADHCALGVPQFARGRSHGEDIFSSSQGSTTTSYRPKRVETFALGELRRNWSSNDPNNRDSAAKAAADSMPSNNQRDIVDSPAVAVAAAAHHTLVSTRSGRLFSFGLGKGGRLGTGDENHRPLPTRILGPLTNRIVASIAAAENHSLCSTSEGDVYAWGSNGFGQLGILSSNNANGNNNGRLSPRRVEGELKHAFVVAVAAGDRHSVALTRLGEVYCWGDNRSGQLGTYNSALIGGGGSSSSTASASPSSSQTNNNGRCCHRPQRVEGLWSLNPRRRAIAIAAAEFSTLVLTMPPTVSATGESSLASLPVNTIYGWGHGNHSPMRVNFPSVVGGTTMQDGITTVYARSICINPIAIACAKYHSVAITADGRVYTWGLHSESLGIEKKSTATTQQSKNNNDSSDWATSENKKQSQSSTISSPQLVVGMENTGSGRAVAVSASESHTAVVTSDGHLFTWGTSHGNDVLGHKGVRWQPIPRRVTRVHRAVGVAAGKEHTALLMGVSFPPLPCHGRQPDDDVPVVDNDGHHCQQPLSLQDSAAVEISRNVDLFNVIPVALVAHRLNCRPLIHFCEEFVRKNLDGVLAVGSKNDFCTFLSSQKFVGTRNNDGDGAFHPFLYRLANSNGWVGDGRVLLNRYAGSIMLRPKKQGKRAKREERAAMNVREEKGAAAKQATESMSVVKEKEISSGKKKSVIILVEENEEQQPQIVRKLFQEKAIRGNKTPGDASPNYHCDVCGISCQDSDSYTFHINGRKHRNRLMHAKSKEEKNVAESMMAMKRMQLMENNGGLQDPRIQGEPSGTKSKSAWATTQKAAVTPRAVEPSSEKKVRSKTFQDILNEEQKRSSNDIVKARGKFSTPIAAKPRVSSSTVAAATYPTKKTLPPQVVAYNMKKPFPITSPGPSLPLSAFMKKNGAQKQRDAMSSSGASWGAKPANDNNSGASWGGAMPARKTVVPIQLARATAPSKMKSFSKIQQEEEARVTNEDHMSRIDGNQWFVQQRDRAASMGEIQEKEKREREMFDLIEEQKQIEKEIMERLKQEENAKKHGKKKHHGRKKSKKSGNVKSKKNPTPPDCQV